MTLGKHLKKGVVKQRSTPNSRFAIGNKFSTSTSRETVTMRMGKERNNNVRELMVTKS
jgi:hypothetical protein